MRHKRKVIILRGQMSHENRPLTGNASGTYNLDFVDWENEWETVGEYSSERYKLLLASQKLFQWESDVCDNEHDNESTRKQQNENCVQIEVQGNTDNDNQTLQSPKCPICIENFKKAETIMQLNSCKHTFHEKCIKFWLENPGNRSRTCPLCRQELTS